jgi:hypothetical protein
MQSKADILQKGITFMKDYLLLQDILPHYISESCIKWQHYTSHLRVLAISHNVFRII